MATHSESLAEALPFADRPVEKAPGHWVLARAGKTVLRPGGLALSTWALKRAVLPGSDVVEFAPGRRASNRHRHRQVCCPVGKFQTANYIHINIFIG